MSAVKILVAGNSGQVARSLAALSGERYDFVTLGRPELDLADAATLEAAVREHAPAAIVNAAAYTAVDKAESEPDAAFAINRDGAGALAAVAARHGLPIIHISTDYVFAGDKAGAYVESDPVGPQGVYGQSKLEGERAVADANPAHVILRTAWVYSPYGNNFLKTMLRFGADRDRMRVVADQKGTPTYAPDIAAGIAAVLDKALAQPEGSDWRGVFNMVSEGDTDWASFAEAIFAESQARGGPHAEVDRITTADYPTPASRPANSRLDTARFRQVFGHALPAWEDGVGRCIDALK